MKTRMLMVALLGLGTLSTLSCKKIKDAIKINVPVTMKYDVEIPAESNTSSTVSKTYTVNVNVDSIINAANSSLSVKNIKSVAIDSVIFNVDDNSRYQQDNLTALKSLDLYFSSDAQSGEVKLAGVQNPTDPYHLKVPTVQNLDLAPYFDATVFKARLALQMKRATTHAVDGTVSVTFKLTVGL